MPCFLQIRLLLLAITLVEALDTPACSDITLTASVERMALGADINMQLRLRGTCRERISARADNLCLVILRMDILLHL